MFKRLLLLFIVVTALLAAYFILRPTTPAEVTVATVSRSTISSQLELLGTVINDRSVTITALLDGEIVSTRVREGDRVEEGDLLAELDSEAAQLQLEKAKADLLYQQVYLAQVEKNLVRQQGLASKGSATMQSVDDTLLEKKRVEAAVEVANAELAIRKLYLENAQIVAPFTGTIITQSAERGQWVEAGTQLFVLVADEGRVIEAQVDADDAAQVSLGQAAQLSSDSFDGQTWDSTVVWLAPSITRNNNGASNTFAIRIALDDDAPNLLLDQQLDVTIVTDSREDVVVIPQKLLAEVTPGEYSVLLIENDTVQRRSVTTGLFSTSEVEISEGLKAGDTVLLKSNKPIDDGQTVNVLN